MNLYIQVENNQTINHPVFEDNLLQVFGKIPDKWEPFVRVPKPILSVYETLISEQPIYEKINDVWTDVWIVNSMTEIEKKAKQQETKDLWASREYASNWSKWIFDEEKCIFVPPIPRPEPDMSKIDQGIFTFWCGSENGWKDTPVYPKDNNSYKFNFLTWEWVAI